MGAPTNKAKMKQHLQDREDLNAEVLKLHGTVGHTLSIANDTANAIWDHKTEFTEDKYTLIKVTTVNVEVPDDSGRSFDYFIIEQAMIGITKEEIKMPEHMKNHPIMSMLGGDESIGTREDHEADTIKYWITLDLMVATEFASRLRDLAIEEEAKLAGVDLSSLADNEQEDGSLPHEEGTSE